MAILYVPGAEHWPTEAWPLSPSAPESADSTSDSSEFSEGVSAPWAGSSGTLTQRPFSWRGWKTRPWIARLSSTISRPSLAQRTAAEWISCLQASPVSRSHSRGTAPAPTTPDGSGPSHGKSSAKRARGRSSSKTSADSTPQDSNLFSATLPKHGGLRNGEISARPTLARPIGETGSFSSLWPTATATDSKASGAAGYSTASGRHSGTTLTDAAVRQWPTPTAQSYGNNRGGAAGRVGPVRHSLESMARHEWATPTARDWRSEVATQSPEHSPPLGRQVLQTSMAGDSGLPEAGQPRQLSVPFVELLMGFPIGFSDSGPTD